MNNKLVVGLFFIVILTIAGVGMNLVYSSLIMQNYLKLSQLKQTYQQESAGIPELRDTEFEAYGGDLLVKANVGEKGSVVFWYDPQYVPRLTMVNDKPVGYTCQLPDGSQPFVMSLEVIANSVFLPDLGFEIRNLADLVAHFDELLTKLNEYRQSPAYGEPVFLQIADVQSIAACQPIEI